MKQVQLQRKTEPIRMRNYGRIIQDMITYACTIEDESERNALVLYIAQCMRQKNLVWNKDQEPGINRIQEDLIKLSDGKLSCDFEAFRNFSQAPAQSPSQGQTKKRKK